MARSLDKKPKILLVDDEVEITELLGDVLRIRGFDVAEANSGSEAVEKAESADFDVVITDIRMPDMDGLQLMDVLKNRHPKLGFIVISGYSVYSEAEILKKGAYCFLHKPVSPVSIIESLQHYFSHSEK